jgi:hypothetical protein
MTLQEDQSTATTIIGHRGFLLWKLFPLDVVFCLDLSYQSGLRFSLPFDLPLLWRRRIMRIVVGWSARIMWEKGFIITGHPKIDPLKFRSVYRRV